MAQLLILQRAVCRARSIPALQAAAGQLRYATKSADQAHSQVPAGDGTVFNTAGTEAIAADPGPVDRAARPGTTSSPATSQAAAGHVPYASSSDDEAGSQAPAGNGTVFNTAGTEAVAADPGPGDRAARPGTAGSPAGPRAHVQPAAAVMPAAAAAAVEAARAAEAAGAASEQRHAAAGRQPEANNAGGASGGASAAQDGSADSGSGGAAAADSAAGADFAAGELSEEQRDVLATIVREALASEAAAAQLVRAQRAVLGGRRPDLASAAGDADAATGPLKQLAPALRARPSALGPLWAAAGAAAGVAAGVAPKNIADAIRGGAAEALAEAYTGHLRRIAALGLAGSPVAAALRDALRTLRDIPRAPEDAPHVPDLVSSIMNQGLPRNMTLPEGVGGLTKLGFQAMFTAASHI